MAGENAEGNAGEGKAPDEEDDKFFVGRPCGFGEELIKSAARFRIGDVLEVKIEKMLEPLKGDRGEDKHWNASVKGEYAPQLDVKGSGFGVGDTVKVRIVEVGLGYAVAEAIEW